VSAYGDDVSPDVTTVYPVTVDGSYDADDGAAPFPSFTTVPGALAIDTPDGASVGWVHATDTAVDDVFVAVTGIFAGVHNTPNAAASVAVKTCNESNQIDVVSAVAADGRPNRTFVRSVVPVFVVEDEYVWIGVNESSV
jgi:hypothetical protein